MPWNGSGIFTRNYSWVNDAANNINITASRMDADTNDIVSNGLNNCLTRDGQGSAIANLPMNGFRHTGASAGVGANDYVIMSQISGFAPLASPNFTGIPSAPTASAGTSTSQIATTQFVNTNYAALAGATFSGPVGVNSTLSVQSLMQFTGSGASLQFAGAQLVYDVGTSNSLGFRSGSPGSFKFFSMDASGNFNALNGNVTSSGSISAGGNITTSGIFVSGSINQPTIFVQSSTPTARNTGDLWFW